MEVRPEILSRLRNQARALRDVGKARNDASQRIFCSCCCEYFKDGEDRRSVVAHMHEYCIDQLLSPDGNPTVGSGPPATHHTRIAKPQVDFAPPLMRVDPVSQKVQVVEIAAEIADHVGWLTEDNQAAVVSRVVSEVSAQLEPLISKFETIVNELKALVEEGE